MRISKNFSMGEICKSDIGTRLGLPPNDPDEDNVISLTTVVQQCAQPLRDHFERPIRINSGFRNLETNRAVGSKDTSHHRALNGYAALDLEIMGYDNKEMAREITKVLPQWHTLILELYDEKIKDPVKRADSGWIHLSFERNGNNPKNILRAFRKGKDRKIVYEPWDLS